MLNHPPRSNPDTHKAGDSPKAIPAGCPATGRTIAGVANRLRCEPHMATDVYGDDTLLAVEFLQFIDFREPSRSHAAGHGLNDRPGCTGSKVLSHE